jgi:hypothetical protein
MPGDRAIVVRHTLSNVHWHGGVNVELARTVYVLLLDVTPLQL